MGKYVGDLLFGGFVIILLVLFLRHSQEALNLSQGLSTDYTNSVSQLSQL